MQHKIALIGGPGTGKTSVLNNLKKRGFSCKEEISREVTLQGQKEGISQLFLTDPILFSEKLLEGRVQQFLTASKSKQDIVFFDRGIPDIHAYLNYSKTKYSSIFIKKSKTYLYSKVFMFLPWKDIYISDNERYENFNEAVSIHQFLLKAYKEVGYTPIEIPFGSITERSNFILNSI